MTTKMRVYNKFSYKQEDGLNPYIGFTSYQHFNGEKLYSDSVVKPENNWTETEAFECYPIPEDVEENGRQQGFYPDSSVAYIRVLWKEFEPEQGVYNYKFIEDILSQTKAHNQTLAFRLMAHSTRARDDVPQWLKKLIETPERPDGMRVKDSPTDPLFLELFCKAVRKIGERFDEDPAFGAIDISLPGAWGEGHNLHLYSQEALNEIVDTYLDVFKNTQIMTQVGRHELIAYAGKTTNIGWRGDGLGYPELLYKSYPNSIAKVQDNWKVAPVSFESFWWLGEWKRKGWDIDEIIEKTLGWHISLFNGKSLPIPNEWKDKVDYWLSKMGYHFAVDYAAFPEKCVALDTLDVELGIENRGVAPIYKAIPLKIRLSNGAESYEFETDVDIRRWMPGKTTEEIKLKLPESIKKGEYSVEIGIYNSDVPVIYFCTDAARDGAFYQIGKITVT